MGPVYHLSPTRFSIAWRARCEIAAIARREGVERLVVGEPVGLDGTRGEAAGRARRFGERLAERAQKASPFADALPSDVRRAALAVARVDDAAVNRWHIADPANPGRDPVVVAYPAAGTTNATVTLRDGTANWLVTTNNALNRNYSRDMFFGEFVAAGAALTALAACAALTALSALPAVASGHVLSLLRCG